MVFVGFLWRIIWCNQSHVTTLTTFELSEKGASVPLLMSWCFWIMGRGLAWSILLSNHLSYIYIYVYVYNTSLRPFLYIHTYMCVCIKNLEKKSYLIAPTCFPCIWNDFSGFRLFFGKTSWFRPQSHGLGMTIGHPAGKFTTPRFSSRKGGALNHVRIWNPYNQNTYVP